MASWTRLEKCLLPAPEIVRWKEGEVILEKCTTIQKIIHWVKNFFTFQALLIALPFTLVYDWNLTPNVTKVETKSDLNPLIPAWPPAQRGFATSHFQTVGLGTKWSPVEGLQGKCDWDKWMDTPSHINAPKNFDYKNFFTDILSDPSAYIQMLKDQNVTAHRFSLEWSVIEPKRGEVNEKAVELYNEFINKLIEAEITPSVTLSHFVVPEWFYESGNFQKLENVNAYLNFALNAIDRFPQVKEWWSFNELGVKAFQQAREVYPTDIPEGSSLSSRVYAAGTATRNMLIAHCKLHKKVEELHPDKKVGVTHQWLKFDTANGNWLERLFAYIFTKFGFTSVYNFFKDGKFSFEFPFIANIQFEIPQEEFEKHGHFIQQLGVQAYPKPMLKMGLNHGETYPGVPGGIKNFPFFSFGSSCEPGGTVMRFGPRWKPEGMDEILDEAFALSPNVFITEYGSDAKVQKWGSEGFLLDNEAQAIYLQNLTEKIQQYSERTLREIKGIYCWSDLRRQLEWENGHECNLPIVNPIVDEKRRMVGYHPTPASEYLKGVFGQLLSHHSQATG